MCSSDLTQIYLIDTPGHPELAAEMERTLFALDCAILVVEANEGVRAHTRTLKKLLEKHNVPTFLFVNKMDLSFRKREEIMELLREEFGSRCVDFYDKEHFFDDLSFASEKLTETILETETLDNEDIAHAVEAGEILPCYFGSALNSEGVKELLEGLGAYTCGHKLIEEFGARVFKIGRDERGKRLTFLKLTGGCLAARVVIGDEKVTGIRIYKGSRYTDVDEVFQGDLCAVVGLEKSFSGQGLGFESDFDENSSESYLLYDVILPEETSADKALADFMKVSEEYPELNVEWDEKLSRIRLRMMGHIQREILRGIVEKRFGYTVDFSEGSILYRESIPENSEPVEGIARMESQKTFAEVHLLVQAAPRGSGNLFFATCDDKKLGENHQRLIISYLEDEIHRGVHYGYPVTDIQVRLVAGELGGRSAESGELKETACRALRHALMQLDGVLLEPFFEFVMEVPQEYMGIALTDIAKMGGSAREPETDGEMSILRGKVPVSGMKDYLSRFHSYTNGCGRISLSPSGYGVCNLTDRKSVV